jgi:uncharacterized protein (DUF488 family)
VSKTIWTAGYQGRDLEEFLDLLRERGIAQVIDVRERPWSRKPGFSQTPLRDSLHARGLAYLHLPGLGCPSTVRGTFREHGALPEFRASYEEHLSRHPEDLAELERAARDSPSVVLCLERRVEDCHRYVLHQRLEREGWVVEDL